MKISLLSRLKKCRIIDTRSVAVIIQKTMVYLLIFNIPIMSTHTVIKFQLLLCEIQISIIIYYTRFAVKCYFVFILNFTLSLNVRLTRMYHSIGDATLCKRTLPPPHTQTRFKGELTDTRRAQDSRHYTRHTYTSRMCVRCSTRTYNVSVERGVYRDSRHFESPSQHERRTQFSLDTSSSSSTGSSSL